ncbi:deoxyribose-phosphate aldolase [Hyperthermus butylicus]|uniref:Deoxyribose-phosphate aldolase n=1 Tax=Hyperthermus butylicus (strain DSM 5456 / JCM 9403 / PLM1-5) TaxID=415426 RepID=A2BLE9_HYPBU|nr:deoxyribose-phosphate aldolase [Hyperthermus butylicus]ABM80810.1 Deoxyribose-phosphate aldolase [Hyperthermus butylicus DSM 5456]
MSESFFCRFGVSEIASRIDHAVLKPWSSVSELEKAIRELEELNLRCLIISPTHLRLAREKTNKCLGVVVGFPFGYSTIEAKIKELEDSIALGAQEIDYVANTQLLLAGRTEEYLNEIRAAITICRDSGVKCKVIIEAPALPRNLLVEIVEKIAMMDPHPDYIKTSTGYGPRPTYVEDVYLIDQTLRRIGKRDEIGIKAAGGIREGLQAAAMLLAGADVIGTSTPRQVIETYKELCRI